MSAKKYKDETQYSVATMKLVVSLDLDDVKALTKDAAGKDVDRVLELNHRVLADTYRVFKTLFSEKINQTKLLAIKTKLVNEVLYKSNVDLKKYVTENELAYTAVLLKLLATKDLIIVKNTVMWNEDLDKFGEWLSTKAVGGHYRGKVSVFKKPISNIIIINDKNRVNFMRELKLLHSLDILDSFSDISVGVE